MIKFNLDQDIVIKTIEDLIKVIDGGFSFEIFFEKLGIDWDYEAETFEEMGADDLDVIEMIMELEKTFDCEIRDECGELMLKMNPNDLLISVRRKRKLDDLGI